MMPITCYLCGKDAESRGVKGGKVILCSNCKYYWLSSNALLYYFERKDGSELLDQTDKDKLINYIKKYYDPKEGEAVRIYSDTIVMLTGKKSVSSQ